MENKPAANESRFYNVFFQSTPSLPAHVQALRTDAEGYVSELRFLIESGTFAAVSSGVKARILAGLHITSQHSSIPLLLEYCEATEISKGLTLLDRPRATRQLCRRIQRIEKEHPELIELPEEEANSDSGETSTKKRKKCRKIDLYRSQKKAIDESLHVEEEQFKDDKACVDTAVLDMIKSSSVSGALARKVRKWAKANLKSDFLEFVMLTLPPEPWKVMADLVHFNPSDFCIPYFLHDLHRESSSKEKQDSDKNTEDKEDSEKNTEEKQDSKMTSNAFVSRMRDLVKELDRDDLSSRFYDIADEFPQIYLCYAFIRKHKKLMAQADIVEQVASNIPLDTALWYFEELFQASHVCESIVQERLRGEEELYNPSRTSKATYGKLIERILTFRRMTTPNYKEMETLTAMFGFPWTPQTLSVVLHHNGGDLEETVETILNHGANDPSSLVRRLKGKSRRTSSPEDDSATSDGLAEDVIPLAEARLEALRAKWKNRADAKVAVFGDASASMQCAIEAATIFASMVSECFDGELSFFNHDLVSSPHTKPSTVRETLEVCDTIRADGTTSLAAALWPYYEAKKSMDMIVLVTDEEENEKYQGHLFAELLAKYKEEVNQKVTLIVVCVGNGNNKFRQDLTDANIEYRVVYIDGSRPDLVKFDALLGQIAILSSRCTRGGDNIAGHKRGEGSKGDNDWTMV